MGPQLVQQLAFGSLTLSAANDKYQYAFLPFQVLWVGFVVTTTLTTTAAVLTWDIVEADTTAANPTGAAALGTTTATSSTMAVNLGVYYDVATNKGRRIVYPGEAIRCYASTTAAAGVVQPFAIVQYLGLGNADMRGSVTSHPGSTTLATALAALTKVTA